MKKTEKLNFPICNVCGMQIEENASHDSCKIICSNDSCKNLIPNLDINLCNSEDVFRFCCLECKKIFLSKHSKIKGDEYMVSRLV